MKIYNTLTGKKEELIPIKENEYKIYSCGPTVYDYFHIGNARPFIVFDTLRRYLEFRGNKVNFVQNFTDIDDKIINKAKEEGIPYNEVSEKYIEEYFKDAQSLNIRKANYHPKVSENIEGIAEMINILLDKGYAYIADGDVYFKARKFADYGKLSKKNIDELEAGIRVDVNEKKEDPLDFALWKKAKEGEPAFPLVLSNSETILGRPGWHIECSVMSKKYLGDTIDIHGGGSDLIFPHHENEIAQSESANGRKFANYFMHNGYINIDNQKMSKSLGNFKTVREILEENDGDVIRFLILSSLYRSPISFSKDILRQANVGYNKLLKFKNKIYNLKINSTTDEKIANEVSEEVSSSREKLIEALEDDFNTARAIGEFFKFISRVNKIIGSSDNCDEKTINEVKKYLTDFANIFGLLENEKSEEAKAKSINFDDLSDEIKAILEERKIAREQKDYQKSDELRDKLRSLGYEVKDKKDTQEIVIIS